MIGACTKTLRRWEERGTFKPSHRTAGNHRRYSKQQVLVFLRPGGNENDKGCNESMRVNAAIYSRVSSSRQKTTGDLARQQDVVKEYCAGKNYHVSGMYTDVGSGLNDNRKGLLKLLKDVTRGKHDVVVVNYQDRLSRFGLNVIKEHFAGWGVAVEVIHPAVVNGTPHAALITDLTAILYSFMGRLYRSRRGGGNGASTTTAGVPVGGDPLILHTPLA